MADESDIEDVKDLLPSDSEWDDEKIGLKLDAGRTVFQVVQNYWESMASRYHSMIDVSESGSSRSLSRLYDNALKQAEYWKSRADKEAEETEEDEDDRPLNFNSITRV